MMDTSKKELIWVEKEFAARFSKIESDEEKQSVLNKYIDGVAKKAKDDYSSTLECMKEDAVLFQGLMLETKRVFEKTKNESLSAFYDLWENYDKEKSEVVKKVNAIKDELEPLKKELKEIKDLCGSINTWEINKLMETMSMFRGISKDSKDMLLFAYANYKKE
jgi:hypothetical protein